MERVTTKKVGNDLIYVLNLKGLELKYRDDGSVDYDLVNKKGEIIPDITVSKVVENYIEQYWFQTSKTEKLKRNYCMVIMDTLNFNAAVEIATRKCKIYLKKIQTRLKNLKKINHKV